MDTYQTICSRSSVREYKKESIEKKILEVLVDAGRRAPSARAVEPWDFIVLTNKTVLSKISAMVAANAPFLKDAASCIVIVCKDTKYYLEDGCAATENILLKAVEEGLGACWVAGDKKDYAHELLNMLNVPVDYKLVSLISLGWPSREKKQHKSRSLDNVIHWEKF